MSSLVLGKASNPAHTYKQRELLNLLAMPTRRDASLLLAGQLIAAKLNIANGSNPAPIAATVARADALLGAFAGRLPYGVTPNTPIGTDMTATARALEDYNRGLLPGSCGTTNRAPVANAGPDQTVSLGGVVTLNGTASSDPDGDPLSFNWTLVSKPADSNALLSDVHATAPTFIADKPGTYEVQLVVRDASVTSSPDIARISTRNSAPIANAGADQTRRVGELVQLNGEASSDPDGGLLTFAWTFAARPAASTASLSDPSAVNPTFSVDVAGHYELQLIVSDGHALSEADTVIVSTVNSTPVANAGPDTTGRVGETISLDGSTSNDVDGDALTFSWAFTSRPAGSAAALSDAAAVSPAFTIDVFGEYTLQLVVDDGTVQSAADTVIVSTINSRPIANAGPDQTIFVGVAAHLDGSGSTDVDGNALTYRWSLTTRPAASTATLSDATAVRPTMVPDVPGTYVAQLTVTDGLADSDVDTVLLTTANRAPIADAGPDRTMPVGATAALNGTASRDPDGDPLIFNWSFLSKPPASAAVLSDASSPSPSFIVDVAGTYVLQLIASDALASSPPDTVTISTENSRPTADAGPDRTVETGATVVLDGRGSSDPDETPLVFAWSLLSRPAGSKAEISDAGAVSPTLVADVDGIYVVQLIVTDGALLSVADTMTVTADSAADLAVALLDAPAGTHIPGTAVTFSVQMRNLGPLDANDVIARMQVPVGYTAISIVPSAGTYEGTSGNWTIGPLAASVTVRLDVQATVNATGSLALTATIIGSNRSDPDLTNNTVAATAANRPPVANAGSDAVITVGATAVLNGDGSTDADGDPLSFRWTLTTRPPGSAATLIDSLSFTSSFVADRPGAFLAELEVTDSSGAAASDTVLVTAAANRAPLITSLPVTAAVVGAAYAYDVAAVDPDAGETLAFSLPIAPAGMTIDPGTGLIHWTPLGRQTGSNNVAVHVRDRAGLFAAQGFTIEVGTGAGNGAPTADDDEYDARSGESLSVAAPGVLSNDVDPDGNRLRARALTQPANGTAILNADGSLTYTPFSFQEGELLTTGRVNLPLTVTGTTMRASTVANATSRPESAFDGSLGTSWMTAGGDAAMFGPRSLTAANPFIEAEFPSDVTVTELRVSGHRGSETLRIQAGEFQLFDAQGAELFYSGPVSLPSPNRDGRVSVPDLFERRRNGARTVPGALYRASSASTGKDAARAFDGNIRTDWVSRSPAVLPEFIEVEFPADQTIHRVRVFGGRESTTQDFVSYFVQVFDGSGLVLFDSGTITVSATLPDTTISVGNVPGARRVRVTGTALEATASPGRFAEVEVMTTESSATRLNDAIRRARFTDTADVSGQVALAEFIILGSALVRRERIVERNLAYLLPTSAISSSVFTGNPSEHAIDGTVRNWYAATGNAGEFLEIEFPTEVTVAEIKSANPNGRPDGFGTSLPIDCFGAFELFASDGTRLFDSGQVNTPTGSLTPTATFSLAVPEIATVKRLRYTSDGCSGFPVGFSELHVFGSTAVTPPPLTAIKKFHAVAGREAHSTPLVVNLTDDNGDSRIDRHDVPDIVVAVEAIGDQLRGELKIVSGDDGRDLMTLGAPNLISPWSEPAVADIDGDGAPEIVAVHSDGNHLIAFEHTGDLKWVSDAHAMPRFAADTRFVSGAVSIANLDGSGPPEIIIASSVFSAEGRLLADGRTIDGTTGGTGLRSAISAVADIDLDGTPELVAGPTAYRYAGGTLTKLWRRTDRLDGYVAIANLDDDPLAELVIVANGFVYALNHDGTDAPFWNQPSNSPVPLPGGGQGGAPTIADIDGDGIAEIGVAGAGFYTLFNRDGSVRWKSVISDRTSNATGSTVFDLDGDGSVEVIYRDEAHLRIYRGSDGVVLSRIPIGSSTWSELPVVADVDNDGHADVVVASDRFFSSTSLSDTGVYVLSDIANRWTRTRRVWNQHAYHVTNIDEDASIPLTATPHFVLPELNSFRLNAVVPDGSEDARDRFTYVASDGERESLPATVRLAVRKPNSTPRITSTGVVDAAVGIRYLYAVRAADPDSGDIITFSLPTAPAGMSIDPALGLIQWTPGDTERGTHDVVVKVQDLRGLYVLQGYSVQVADPISVPDIVGLVQSAASTAIVSTNLAVGAIATRHSPTVAVDTVINQNPRAGTLVAPHSAVNLVVSLGPAPAGTVPDVVGQPQSSAEADIVAAGFSVGPVSGAHNATVPASTVLSQTPEAGSEAELGLAIAFVVSLGAPPGERDLDGDGFSGNQGDCNDTNPAIRPGAVDVPADGIDQNCNGVDSIEGDGTLPVATLASPDDLATVTMPTDIAGTASDANLLRYTLTLAEVDSTATTIIGNGSAAVTSGILGRLDPTLLENGLYRVRLVVEDVNGQTAVDERVYRVDGMAKVGNFRLSFTDLSLPVAGVPITIIRTYDSRVKSKEDFGIGWMLDIKRGSYRHNRTPGLGWVIQDRPFLGDFLPCVGGTLETRSHLTEVRLSDRESYTFALEIENGNLGITGACEGEASYRFVGGTRPGATLEILDGTAVIYLRGGGGDHVLEMNSFLDGSPRIFDPRRVRLTTADGRSIEFDRSAGITRMEDLNGNTLSITASGIVHSSGRSISVARDAVGRIASITDPKGNTLGYAYDDLGNLRSFTDQTGHVTTFVYDARHNLLEVRDAIGRVARSEYDDSGRLIAVIDPLGNRTSMDHDLDGRQEVITDRLGKVTILGYDERGNVVRRQDALGNVTTFTYDLRDNRLSETDPLGNTRSYTYDDADNLLSDVDALGNTTRFTYNSRHQVLTTTDPRGGVTTRTFDGDGNLLSVTDAAGGRAVHTYNAQGNRISTTDSVGSTWSFGYDASGNVIQATDPLGHVTNTTRDANGNALVEIRRRVVDGVSVVATSTFDYDALNRRIRIINAGGAEAAVTYSASGQIASRTDPPGTLTIFTYDENDRLVLTAYADGTRESATYDAEGRRLSVTDRAERTTTFSYDGVGRLLTALFPDGATRTARYDAAGRKISETDALDRTTQFTYDAAGRLTSTRDPAGATTAATYDAASQIIASADRNGHVTRFDYDGENRVIRTTLPDATFTLHSYDTEGQRISHTDPAGNITRYEYSPRGALTRVVDPLGHATQYAFDELDKRVSQTDALGNTTRFGYDILGRQISTTLPLGQTETRSYDLAGRLIARRDYNGALTTYSYDVMNRLTRRMLPDGGTHDFSYTPTGKVASFTDATGTTTFTYDQRDRPIIVRTPDASEIQYTYDTAGNRTAVATPGGTVAYSYDVNNRLTALLDYEGNRSTFGYDLEGNLTRITYANGIAATYEYDAVNRLTDITHSAGLTTLRAFHYTLGPSGNRTRVVEDTGRIVDYTYDALFRLTQETISTPGAGTTALSYTYDAAGNRSSHSGPGGTVSYTYDANGRLLRAGATTFAHDANGNLLSRLEGTALTTYEYDGLNQIVRSSSSDGVMQYAYDAMGHRVQQVSAAGATRYLIDPFGANDLSRVLRQTDASGAVDYVFGGGILIGTRRPSATSFYLHDGRMSTRMLADASGLITDRYDYDAFGNVLSRAGSTPNLYLFDGQQFDPELRLYHLRARYYDPSAGRFTARDPFPGLIFDPASLHPYTYAHNDPINKSDPSGEFSLMEQMAIVSAASSIIAIGYSAHNLYLYRSAEVAFEAGVDAFFSHASLGLDMFGLGSLIRSLGLAVVKGVSQALAGKTLINQTGANIGKSVEKRLTEVFENVLCRTNSLRRCGLTVISAAEVEELAAKEAIRKAEVDAALEAARKGAAEGAKKQAVRIKPEEYTAKELMEVTVVSVREGFKSLVRRFFIKPRP